jgi:diacylglycerol kinase family enzyme
MKIIFNSASGRVTSDLQIAGLPQVQTNQFKMEQVDGEQNICETAKRLASGPDEMIIVAGGDGTINAVASALIGTKKMLGVLPCGTFNHFAKDLGIPLEIEKAAKVIQEQYSILVDVAEVNGRIFLNNSSVGFYSSIVRNRAQQEERFFGLKRLAFLRALLTTAWRFPILELSVSVADKTLHRRTPFLFVGNNEYKLEKRQIGTRSRLDGGNLSIFVAHANRPLALLLLALRAISGRLHAARDFDAFCTSEAVISATRDSLIVARDGEIERIKTPLHYRTRPRSLRVIVPSAAWLRNG